MGSFSMWKLPFIFVFLLWEFLKAYGAEISPSKSQGKVHLDQTFPHGRIRQILCTMDHPKNFVWSASTRYVFLVCVFPCYLFL